MTVKIGFLSKDRDPRGATGSQESRPLRTLPEAKGFMRWSSAWGSPPNTPEWRMGQRRANLAESYAAAESRFAAVRAGLLGEEALLSPPRDSRCHGKCDGERSSKIQAKERNVTDVSPRDLRQENAATTCSKGVALCASHTKETCPASATPAENVGKKSLISLSARRRVPRRPKSAPPGSPTPRSGMWLCGDPRHDTLAASDRLPPKNTLARAPRPPPAQAHRPPPPPGARVLSRPPSAPLLRPEPPPSARRQARLRQRDRLVSGGPSGQRHSRFLAESASSSRVTVEGVSSWDCTASEGGAVSSRERVAREGRAAWRWRWSEGEAEEMEEERGAEEMEEEREAMGRSRLLGNANPWGGDPGDARGSEAPSRDGRLGSRHSYAVKTMSDSADAAVDVDPHVHPRHAAYNRAGDQASPRERSHFWCLGWPYREDGFWDSRRGAGETFWETDRGYGSEDGFWERRDTVSRTVRGDFGEGAGRRGAEEHACAREPRDNVSMTATRARASENHDATASTEGALEDSHSQVGDSEDELTCSPASPGSGKSPQSAGLAARLAWEPRRCPAVGAQLARLGNEYHTCKATGCAFSDPGCPAFGPGGSEDRGRPQLGNSVAERISGWPDECYGAVRAYASAGDSHGDGSDAETGVERRPSVQEAMSRAGGPEEDIQPNEWLACGATATGVASSTPGVDYGARGVVIDSSLEARAREQKRGVPWGPGDKEQQCWRQDNESNITRQQQSTDTWHFSPVARPKRVRMRRCSATAAETNESSIGGTGRGEGEELCGGRGEQRRKLASTGGNTTSLTESQRGWQARSKGRDLVRSGGSAWRGGTWGHKKAIWNVRTAKNLELRLAHAALAASASDMRLFWRPGITSKRECECPPPQQQRAFLERPWRNGMATFPMSRGGSPQCDDKSGSFEGAQGFMRASSGSRGGQGDVVVKKEDRGHIALELVALDRLISALEGEASTPDQVLAARQLRDALMDLRDKACLLQGSD